LRPPPEFQISDTVVPSFVRNGSAAAIARVATDRPSCAAGAPPGAITHWPAAGVEPAAAPGFVGSYQRSIVAPVAAVAECCRMMP
jgi:hypothetical protein